MAITAAQRNAGAYQLVIEMATEFPRECDALAWIIVESVKSGTATQKEIAKALFRDLWTAATGQDPTANAARIHKVRHRLYDIVNRFALEHPGLTIDDAFDPEVITVI